MYLQMQWKIVWDEVTLHIKQEIYLNYLEFYYFDVFVDKKQFPWIGNYDLNSWKYWAFFLHHSFQPVAKLTFFNNIFAIWS